MTATDYLKKCKVLRMIADELEDDYQRLEAIATSPSHAPIDGLTGQFHAGSHEMKMIRMTEAGSEALAAELDYWKYRDWLFDLLIEVPGKEAIALIEKYINEKAMKEICDAKSSVFGAWITTTRQTWDYVHRGRELFRELLISKGIEVE